MGHVIPPITDPLGVHWDQPDRSLVEVDDTHALMARTVFEQLKEYSASNPSGVYPGKMWRRHDGAFDPGCPPARRRWLLCWYGVHKDPGRCTVNYRDVLLVY